MDSAKWSLIFLEFTVLKGTILTWIPSWTTPNNIFLRWTNALEVRSSPWNWRISKRLMVAGSFLARWEILNLSSTLRFKSFRNPPGTVSSPSKIQLSPFIFSLRLEIISGNLYETSTCLRVHILICSPSRVAMILSPSSLGSLSHTPSRWTSPSASLLSMGSCIFMELHLLFHHSQHFFQFFFQWPGFWRFDFRYYFFTSSFFLN